MTKNNIIYAVIRSCISQYATFKGRASRSEYWTWAILTGVVGMLLLILDTHLGYAITTDDGYTIGKLNFAFRASVFLPSLAVSVRRLHDVNKSGWWILISFTIIGIIPLIYWHCCKSYDKTSKYGKPGTI